MQEQILETRTKYVDLTNERFLYLIELKKIMIKYGIHRIYRITIENGLHEAHQSLECQTNPNNVLLSKLIPFIKDKCPFIYFNIIIKSRLYLYKKSLNKFMKKYDIKTISTNSFSLYQGIYISNHQLCISGVDIVFNNGRVCHIDKAYLDI